MVVIFLLWALSLVLAAPTLASPVEMSTTIDLPIVTLPSGRWRASSYDTSRDVYIFSNIRFAKPPVGVLRFVKPEKPENSSSIQDGIIGNDCVAYVPRKGLNFAGLSQDSAWSTALNWLVPRIMGAGGLNGGSEDCLFLDVYVPGKIFREPDAQRLPVVNWIYGGAYIFGSKTTQGVYSGAHLIEMSKGNMIFVAANYRLGIYGWLSGPTMERDALANAGLYDQRLALEWINENIHVFGGDKTQVSAWGESAGASSILHHLIAYGGKQDPLFRRAILMSPAFQPMGDRRPSGTQEKTTQKVFKWAGCEQGGIKCLQRCDPSSLVALNRKLQEDATQGTYALGPASDGTWVRQFAAAELLQGNYWKDVESMIVSHTAMESTIYTDGHVETNEAFDAFILDLFGDFATKTNLVAEANKVYPKVVTGGRYATQTARMMDMIQDVAFTCNTRFMAQAYPRRVWNMNFGYGPADNGWHSTDLQALFLRLDLKLGRTTIPVTPFIGAWSRTYQSYFVSHALTGSPNTMAVGENALTRDDFPRVDAVYWPKTPTSQGEDFNGILIQGNSTFSVGADYSVPRSRCDFWQNFLNDSVKTVGIAP